MENKTKHTPGPWEACEVLNGLPHTEIREENFGTLKAQFFGEDHRKNAVLCAMAPELLAALENARIALTFYKDEMYRDNRKERKTYPFGIDCEKAARAAIAKARGK